MIKPIIDRVAPPLYRWYMTKPRSARYGDIRLTVPPEVFHPSLLLSTRFLLQFLKQQDLNGLRLLELGAGSGLIAIWTARHGAIVTASDISPIAIATIQDNARHNQADIQVVESDLFQNLQGHKYDRIVINPPYYPRNPSSHAEHAWYCGEDFDYFKRLFTTMPAHCNPGARVWMVLSEDCDITQITALATQSGWHQKQTAQRKRWAETNFIYELLPPQ